jgi:hypothetical protein
MAARCCCRRPRPPWSPISFRTEPGSASWGRIASRTWVVPNLVGARDVPARRRYRGRGASRGGLNKVRQGVDLYQGLKTPPVFWPMLRALEAGTYAQAGRAEDGLAMVDEALEIASRGSGTTVLPEFQLLRGDLLLALPQSSDPEPWFQQAFDLAKRLDARMSQLRAAVRLCRLGRDRDGGRSGAPRLRAVYSTFTEGFTTADLTEARALVKTLP